MNIRPAFILTILLAVCGAVIGYQQSIITQTREEAMQATTALGKERQARIAAENAGRALAQNERSTSKDAFALRDMVAKLENELGSVRKELLLLQDSRQASSKGYTPSLKPGAEALLGKSPVLYGHHPVWTYHSEVNGTKVSSWITDDIIGTGPPWHPGLPLPLDLAKTEQQARLEMSRLVENQETWELNEICLHKFTGLRTTRWFYSLQFANPDARRNSLTVLLSLTGVPGMFSSGNDARN